MGQKNSKIKRIKVEKPDMDPNFSYRGVSADTNFSTDKRTGFKQAMKNNIESFNPFSDVNSPKIYKKADDPGNSSGGGKVSAVSAAPDSKVKLIKVSKPSVNPTAIQHTSKHFDIVLGIDIHWTQIPPPPSFMILPLPLPHPFVGIVFDLMDYIRFELPIPAFVRKLKPDLPESIPMGGSIFVHGRHKATTTTSVMGVLIPFKHITALIPVYFVVSPAEAPHEGEIYYGSETVIAQGSKLSGNQPQQVLTCMGLPFGQTMLPAMPDKPKKNPLAYFAFYNNFASMYVQINTGGPVLIGGPFVPHVYTLGEMAMRFAGMFLMSKLTKALGKGVGKAGKGMKALLTNLNKNLLRKAPMNKFKLANALSKKLQKWGFDPVNFVTGALMFEWDDFEIGGNTPLVWKNALYSDQPYDKGMLGNGVFNNYDLYIIPDESYSVAAWVHPDEYQPMPLPAPEVGTEPEYFRTHQLWQSRPDDHTWIVQKGLDTYTYKRYAHPDGGDVFKIMHIAYKDGSRLDFTYRGGRLLLHTITDQSGRVIETVTNKDNTRIAEVYYTNAGTRELQVRYDYDGQGNLTHVWDRKGKAICFEYDAHNRIIKRTNRNGMEYVFEYDKQGRVIYTTGLNGFQQGRIKYYPELGYNEVIYPLLDNKKETYYYDENDLVYKIVDGEGGETWYDHTVHNERKMIASPEGSTQGYNYDEYGNISTYHTPDGEQYRYTYNEYGQLTARFEPSGVMELWMYDDRQRLVSYTNKLEEVTRYEYEENRRLPAASTDAAGITTCYTYNAQLQLVLLTNSLGLEQHWLYDTYGRVLSYSLRPMVQVQWQRDEMGRVIRLAEPGQAPLNIEYDAYDLPVKATDGKQEWQMDYTPMGSLRRQVRREAISNRHEQTLVFSYDAYENLRSITNEKNEVYRFQRNRNGEVVTETGFDGLTKKYIRNRDGLVTRTLLPQGRSIHYDYDLAGRLVHTRYHDGSWEAYQYDSSGMLIRADNDAASVEFTRNALGMVTEEKQGAHSIQHTYNKQGQLTHLGSSLGAEVVHDYDALGQLSHITAFNGQQGVAKDNAWQSLLRYNELGQLQQRQMSGDVDSSFEYDHAGMPISQKVNAQRQTRLHKDYRWAQGSRLMAVLDRLTGRSTEYSYDLYGSLSAAQYGDGSVQYKNPDAAGNLYETKDRKDRIYDKGGKLLKDKNWYYHYDEEGNLILKSKLNISGLTAGKQVQKQQEEHPYRRSLSNVWTVQEEWKEADLPDASAMAPPGEARWQGGDWEYCWYANGMLRSVRRPDGSKVEMEYDALGRRTARIYNGEISRYLWDGNVILHEWKYNLNLRPKLVIDESGSLRYDREEPVENLITWVYEEGSYVPSAKIQGAEQYSVVSDYIGRPVQAYDKAGNLIWNAEYDIYGRLINLKGHKQFIPFRQLGQYEDEELGGLYYNRFRYYDSENGNYISQDPIGLAGNNPTLYGYVFDINNEVDILGFDLDQQFNFKQAFRYAKRQLRIPSSVNTPKPKFVYDGEFENRTVWAFEGEHKGKFIVMHQEDKFGRGAHLHTASSKEGRVDPTEPGKYNQHDGHIPENFKGLTDVGRVEYK